MSLSPLIVCRGTENWQSLSQEQFQSQAKVNFDPFHWIHPNMEIWSKKIPISYPQCRSALRDISQRNWDRTGIPASIQVGGLAPGRFEIDPEIILLPSDDDDYYNPRIWEFLEPVFADPSVDLVFWKSWTLDCSRSRFRHVSNSMRPSNGYALRSTAVTTTTYIVNHMSVYPGILPLEKTRILSEPLSLKIDHPGSLYLLGTMPLTEDRFPTKPWEDTPPELDWASEELEELFCLFFSIGREFRRNS